MGTGLGLRPVAAGWSCFSVFHCRSGASKMDHKKAGRCGGSADRRNLKALRLRKQTSCRWVSETRHPLRNDFLNQ